MFFSGSTICPVKSYRKYISKLSPKSEFLWPRPLDKTKPDASVWYYSSKLGEKMLGSMMARMSTEYNLSKR